MKPIIFDGRKFANAKLAKLKSKISLLKYKNKIPDSSLFDFINYELKNV